MTTQEIKNTNSELLLKRVETLIIFFNSENYKEFRNEIYTEIMSIKKEVQNRINL